MPRYPYRPELPAPGRWSSFDFADPRLQGAFRLMVEQLRSQTAAFSPLAEVTLRTERHAAWDGEIIACYVFEPKQPAKPAATMLYCHGGGFFLPIQPMMMQLAAQYAAALGLRVVLPEYRILPEHPAPTAFRDCLSVLERIQAQGGDYLLYGESAGGALAAGLALWAKRQGAKPAKGQCLIYPVLDNRCSRYPSARQYTEAAWPLKNNLAMWRAYLKNGRAGLDEFLIPMLAEEVSGLPGAYIEPQQLDILRDEAIAYAEKLRAAGNYVAVNLIEGSYHGFDAAVENPFVQTVVAQRIAAMRQMLGQEE